MLIDKTHIRWGLTSAIILLFATGGYVVYAINSSSHPSGGTLIGLMFGIVASAMMIFAGLLAVRTRFPTVRCGSSQFWLRGHLWLGALSFIFALFHSGFRFGSSLETLLMIAFIVVIASGLHGLAMQQVLPRLLTSRVPMETFGQQIPFICRRMQAESDMLVAEVCGKLECDHEALGDAAYNLAMSLGKLRNGKEGADFQKFLDETYADSASKKMPTSTVQATQVEVAPAAVSPGDSPAKNPATKKTPSKPKTESSAEKSPSAPGAVDKPLSKVEMMRAAAAKKKAANKPAEDEREKPPEPSADKPPVKESVQRKTSPKPPTQKEAAPPAATMTTEVISVACPNCEKQLVLPDRSFLGRIARCPQCSQKFVLGGEEEAEQPEPMAEQFEMPVEKPLSKVEQMRAAAAEKKKAKQEESGQEDKPLSKIEQMRAQAAKKREQTEAGEKPLSKVEQMRAAAAKKKSESEGDDKPLSKIEQMRAAAAAKKDSAKGDSKSTAGQSPKSKGASAKKPTRPKPGAKKPAIPAEPIPRADLLKQFYLANIRPYLESDQNKSVSLKSAVSPQVFAQTRNDLPPQLHDILNQLQEFCEERRQFIVQRRLHWLLHSWLLVHIPATIALFVLFLVHVVVALRVIPWNP